MAKKFQFTFPKTEAKILWKYYLRKDYLRGTEKSSLTVKIQFSMNQEVII